MAWIQHLFVWLFVMSTSAYKCKNCFIFQPYQSIYDQDQNYQIRQMVARSAEDSLRANERSLPIHSETQRIQEEERRRLNPKVEESKPRVENGSYKILNNPPEPFITNRRSQGDATSNDRIVFPGPTSTRSFIPEVPEECKRIGICDSIPNYPKEHVANIISELGDGVKNFQSDELELDTPEIAQRLGPQEENMELCNFRERIAYPQAAPDKEGRWYTVVNPENNRLQGFKVEICDPNRTECANFATFQPGYEARCVQKYVHRSMLVLDADGKTTNMMLKVPSCCSCLAKLTL